MASFEWKPHVKPACDGMSRSEITALLSRELVRLKLQRRNAYSYWAHEVELHDYSKNTLVRVDFVHFEPAWYHASTHAGSIEQGTFTFYEVKSCLEDIKSGHGLNFLGDRNYLVMPVEEYPRFMNAWHGTPEKRYEDHDRKLREVLPHYFQIGFLLYGTARNGWGSFQVIEPDTCRECRKKPASELLLCMMRAMLADSDHVEIDHKIIRSFE